MSVHLQANVPVVNDLLARFPFTSYNSIVQARVELAQQIRLSMQYPQTYQIPIDQQMPADQPLTGIAQFVHPWNVACALMNVCLNGTRFGGDNLAPQEDLLVYVGEWKPLMGCTFPSAVVPAQPAPAPITPQPAPAPAADPYLAGIMAGVDAQPAAAQAAVDPVLAQLRAEADAEATQPAADPHMPAAQVFQPNGPIVAEPETSELPDSNIQLERTGQSGRPQKSPFEKKIEERTKVAAPPFWWEHLLRSAPKIFRLSPAGALDDSSSGSGPVQSYMVLVALLRQVLRGVDPHTSVAALRVYLEEVDSQVSKLESAKAANQLRTMLVPPIK